MTPSLEIADPLAAGAAQAARRSAEALARRQDPAGYWPAATAPDPDLAADWLLWHSLGRGAAPDAARTAAAQQALLDAPLAGLNAQVKAYAALVASGMSPQAAPMAQLRARILEQGGIDAASATVKRMLWAAGLFPQDRTPDIPAEIILSPKALYALAAPARTRLVALAIVAAKLKPAAPTRQLDELRTAAPRAPGSGGGMFRLRVGMARLLGQSGAALRQCEEWIGERTQGLPEAALARVLARQAMGEPEEGATVAWSRDHGETDTATLVWALSETGGAPDVKTAAWLGAREVRKRGEWSVQRPGLEPSGWTGGGANELYPEIPGTAAVVQALARSGAREAAQRGARWLIGMQAAGGGWARFDAASDGGPLATAPFAAGDEVADAPRADFTGRVLEALGAAGVDPGHAAVRRGVKFLEQAQGSEGNWCSGGGDILASTCFVLRGFAAAGESDREAHILRAGEWLRSIQNADGGWGESVSASGAYAPAASATPETAWAVLGLLASGDTTSSSMQKGVEYLIARQRADGGWSEAGPGPRDACPLAALGAFLKSRAGA